MKKFLQSVLLAGMFFSFVSCISISVPGEENRRMNNLNAEYYNIAEAYFSLKKYDKAADYYTLCLKNKETELSAKYQLARCYAFSSKWSDSEKLFSELFERDKSNLDLKLSLAYVHAMSGELETACNEYKALSIEYPENQAVLENYITLLMNMEKSEEAAPQYAVLKEKFPDSKLVSTYSKQFEVNENKEEGENKNN